MSTAALTILMVKCREIALSLVEEGNPENIERITGYSISDAIPTITYPFTLN